MPPQCLRWIDVLAPKSATAITNTIQNLTIRLKQHVIWRLLVASDSQHQHHLTVIRLMPATEPIFKALAIEKRDNVIVSAS